ncbi:DUF2334 domain-containing protein [Clostridium sp.]|uniref:DUF2334 domain-containing protein n=1 Tax=Clostridium sp. TaxID=1506 RepID=UPI00284FC483|nr:DUF2334 domain-containing protein [Clostridium sp.]MDR3596024.1 DUF2334 domain-containing protein [Clostridium sp.]
MIKKFLSIFIMIIIFVLVSCSAKNSIKNIEVEQPKAYDTIPTRSSNKLEVDYTNFKGLNLVEDEIKFKIDGNSLNLNLPIYLDKNRYYISLNELIEKLNGEIEKVDNSLNIVINNNIYCINFDNNTVTCPNYKFPLKKALLNSDDMYYINFSDFSHMLNLYTRWDKDNKIIDCKIDGFKNTNLTPYKSTINQIGLIRFEDVGVTSQAYSKDYFEKLRIIAHYMYEKKIPYHIAWIPRYVIPNQGVDNDPLTKNNFELAEMVYSLDYFTSHNGLIGLHGYTHQCGNTESGAGFEFGKFDPSDTNFEEKIQKAIKTASYLDIPIKFFEVPHYEITPSQNKIAEKYFKILYYPFNDYGRDKADLTKPQLSPYNKASYYISTPLDYIPVDQEEVTLDKLRNNANEAKMGSVFFHPSLEDNYISLTQDNDTSPTFYYVKDSTLKKLIGILEERGFKMISVADI